MTSSRSTVADVIEYDPENKALALNMIEEILEIRQGVLPEVKRKMEVNFYFHCNVGEGHGLQFKEEIEKLLMRPSYCCLSIEEQETINLRNAYSYLMSHCDENQGLLEESMLIEINRIILRNILRDNHYTKAGSYCNNPRITQFRGELYHYQQPDDMQEAVCVLLDRFNSLFTQSINTSPESNKLLSIFKCVAWLVFELLDLHPFSNGNGRLCRLLSSYVLSTCTFHVHALSYTHLQFTYRPRVRKSSYCRKKDRTSECTGKYDHRKQFSSLGLRGLKEKCSYEPFHFTFSVRTAKMDIDE